MADLVIKGIEMPKEWEKILIAADGSVWVNAWPTRGYMRKENVYAVPLPEGHGRLIDADKLADDLQFDVEYDQRALDDLNIVGIERERIQFDKDCKQNCMWYLTKCQTVIPAEGGTDDGT